MSGRSEKEQFWRLVLEEQARSGLSAREFCRREAVSEPSFYAWRRKIGERDSESRVGRVMLPVTVIDPARPSDRSSRSPAVESRWRCSLEIVTGDGSTVRVDESCPVELIRRALVALRLADGEGLSC
jgi:transposase-like protein